MSANLSLKHNLLPALHWKTSLEWGMNCIRIHNLHRTVQVLMVEMAFCKKQSRFMGSPDVVTI